MAAPSIFPISVQQEEKVACCILSFEKGDGIGHQGLEALVDAGGVHPLGYYNEFCVEQMGMGKENCRFHGITYMNKVSDEMSVSACSPMRRFRSAITEL